MFLENYAAYRSAYSVALYFVKRSLNAPRSPLMRCRISFALRVSSGTSRVVLILPCSRAQWFCSAAKVCSDNSGATPRLSVVTSAGSSRLDFWYILFKKARYPVMSWRRYVLFPIIVASRRMLASLGVNVFFWNKSISAASSASTFLESEWPKNPILRRRTAFLKNFF